MANNKGEGNSAAIVAILVIFVLVAAAAFFFFGGQFGGGHETKKVDVNVSAPADPGKVVPEKKP